MVIGAKKVTRHLGWNRAFHVWLNGGKDRLHTLAIVPEIRDADQLVGPAPLEVGHGRHSMCQPLISVQHALSGNHLRKRVTPRPRNTCSRNACVYFQQTSSGWAWREPNASRRGPRSPPMRVRDLLRQNHPAIESRRLLKTSETGICPSISNA